MKPITFKETNGTLFGGPANAYATEQDVSDLPVWRAEEDLHPRVVSCWKMNLKERFSALFFGRVWLQVAVRNSHPPVGMYVERSVFSRAQ